MSGIESHEPEHSSQSTRGSYRRLSIVTLWVPLLAAAPGLLVAGAVAVFFLGSSALLAGGIWYIAIPIVLLHLFKFFFFEYKVEDQALIIRSGAFWRSERRIPFSRIQDIKLKRSFLHRFFQVTKVEITTAGADEQEATLDVISTPEAERIRNAVFRFRTGEEADEEDDTPLQEDLLLRLSPQDLFLGGLTSKIVAGLGALIGAILYFKIFLAFARRFSANWLDSITAWDQYVPGQSSPFGNAAIYLLSWGDTFGGAIVLVFWGVLFSILGFAARYYGYHLTESGGVLTRTHGLFTQNTNSVALSNIQAFKIEESLLRRWFGLVEIWADSGGDRKEEQEKKNRECFVPIVARQRGFDLAEHVLPGLETSEPSWRKISRKAVWRGTRVSWSIAAVAMIPCFVGFGWLAVALLPAFPLLYYLNYKWFKNTLYFVDENYLISRKGWFSKKTLYLPVRNIQNLTVVRNYFDRRLDLAKLEVDTAGQTNTGGGPVIRNLPVEKAYEIQRALAERVAGIPPFGT